MNGLWVYKLPEINMQNFGFSLYAYFSRGKRVESYHLILKVLTQKKTLEYWLRLENALNEKKIANLFMEND